VGPPLLVIVLASGLIDQDIVLYKVSVFTSASPELVRPDARTMFRLGRSITPCSPLPLAGPVMLKQPSPVQLAVLVLNPDASNMRTLA